MTSFSTWNKSFHSLYPSNFAFFYLRRKSSLSRNIALFSPPLVSFFHQVKYRFGAYSLPEKTDTRFMNHMLRLWYRLHSTIVKGLKNSWTWVWIKVSYAQVDRSRQWSVHLANWSIASLLYIYEHSYMMETIDHVLLHDWARAPIFTNLDYSGVSFLFLLLLGLLKIYLEVTFDVRTF